MMVTQRKNTFREIKLKKNPTSQETTESERNHTISSMVKLQGKALNTYLRLEKIVGWKSIVSLRNDTSFQPIASQTFLHLKYLIPVLGFDKL